MFPLLFIPFQSEPGPECSRGDTGAQDSLPACYDLRCSEEFGNGAMNVTITQRLNIGEPTYNVTISTVKVMSDMTVSQSDTGEVTQGLVTKSWTTRRVMKLHSGDREVITRHVKNRGDSYTVENLFGETESRDCQENKKQDNLDKKSKRKKPSAKVNTPERREADRETENIVRIPAEKLDNFLSEPAAVLMEKLFAGRRAGVSLADLRSLNDTGDIIKVSYNSKVDENSLEIIKTLNCSNSDDIILKSVQMDCEGNMLTCKYEDITWVRDKKDQQTSFFCPSIQNVALYQEGRLERLLKQENYRKQNTDFTDICRDLLQFLLMTKPDDPLRSIQDYFKQMRQDSISQICGLEKQIHCQLATLAVSAIADRVSA